MNHILGSVEGSPVIEMIHQQKVVEERKVRYAIVLLNDDSHLRVEGNQISYEFAYLG